MGKGIFYNGGFDLEIYVLTFLDYMTVDIDVLEDTLYEFVYSQNYYLGNDLEIHRYV